MIGNTVPRRRPALIGAVDLLDLVQLHEDCGRALTHAHNGPRERVSGSRNAGISLREEAVTARAHIMGVLAGWAGVVARSRRIAGPQRELRALARFLVDHLDWLLARPDAGTFMNEVLEATDAARRAVHPEPLPRTALGECPAPDCPGTLHVETADGQRRVRCQNGHDWPPRQWLLLAGGPDSGLREATAR